VLLLLLLPSVVVVAAAAVVSYFRQEIITCVQVLFTLSLSEDISNIRIVAIFVIVLSTTFHIEFEDMVMVCLHTKFHVTAFNGSLISVMKQETKLEFMQASCFSTFSKMNYVNKSSIIFEVLLPYVISVF
jgi:hypothetical protein